MSTPVIELGEHEYVHGTIAEVTPHTRIVWVFISGGPGKFRVVGLQPEEQPLEMRLLHHVKAHLDETFTRLAQAVCKRAKT